MRVTSASRSKHRLVCFHAPRFSKYIVKRAPVAWGDTRTAPCAFRLGRRAVNTGDAAGEMRSTDELAGAPAQQRSIDAALWRDESVVWEVRTAREPREPWQGAVNSREHMLVAHAAAL